MPFLALLLATLAGLVVNFVWFSPKTFFPVWWRALGHTDEIPGGADGSAMAPTFVMTTLALAAQAVVVWFALDLVSSARDQTLSLGMGATVGAVLGVGIAAASSLGHRLFSGQGVRVWAIEVGADVLTLMVMGAVIVSVA